MLVYLSSPHLRLVIERKADMFKNAKFKVNDAKGKEVLNHPILQLLNKPNPLQGKSDFLFQWSTFIDIYSNALIYKLKPISFSGGAKVLWNLPMGDVKITPTGKLFQQTKIEDIIEKYTLFFGQQNTQPVDYFPEDVIHATQGASNMYFVGESRILTLKIPISNIDGSMKTRNCIIHDRGALGILSSESKDNAGAIPLGEGERKRIETQMKSNYGIGDDQMQTLITNASLKYTPMTYPTKDLMLFEEVEEDFQTICGEYGMSRDLFPSTKGATFENQEQALKSTYQNTIQPQANMFCDLMMNDDDIKLLLKPGELLVADYSWLPCMKEDELKFAQAEFQKAQSISLMYHDNIIDAKRYAELMGEEKVSGTGEVPVVAPHKPVNDL